MRFAINENNERIEVSTSGQTAICEDCKSTVIGRNGKIRPKHWYHKTKKECDNWYEPTTEWHLEWQNNFPKKNQEVTLFEKETGIFHRADIYLENKLVIEIQYSPINIDEISQREKFYGKNEMIWILNGENLAKNSKIKYKLKRKIFAFEISIPFYSEEVPEYDMDEFSQNILQTERLKEVFNDDNLIKFEPKKGAYFYFEFQNKTDLNELQINIDREIKNKSKELYGWHKSKIIESQIRIDIYENHKSHFTDINLNKIYWRKFIDEMKFPVFFDKLNGLEKEHLYWYQKNMIIKKEDFLKKYKSYT